MAKPFKDFFHYSRGERRGTLLLLAALLIILVFYFVQQLKSTGQQEVSYTDQVIIKRFSSNTNYHKVSSNTNDSTNYFNFDPNTIGVDEWKQLGFTEKQAQSIEKYKNSGAKFYKKEDLKKLYVVDDAKYKQLKPYISIRSRKSSNDSKYKEYQNGSKQYSEKKYGKPRFRIVTIEESTEPVYNGLEKHLLEIRYSREEVGFKYVLVANLDSTRHLEILNNVEYKNLSFEDVNSLKGYYPIVSKVKKEPQLMVDINTADTSELKSLRGIGFSFANRIIKYRKMIGGFHSKQQLMEVYGLDAEKFEKIKDFISVNIEAIVKLNINEATVDDLKSHPYINWKVANSIFFYRKSHGNYAQVEDIKNSDLINEELFLKIAPYITVQ